MIAVQQIGLALKYASDKLKNDRDVVLAAVKQNGIVLQYASDELKNDKEVVLAAVQQYGNALQYASSGLRNDKEIVLAAVLKNGYSLQFTSDELRKDKEIILSAIASDIDACQHSLLKGYQNFEEIILKEGEIFLFSCWNNESLEIRLQVANHPNFLPTVEQIEIGLKDKCKEVQQVYQLRKDELLAKIEENKLRNTI